MVSCQEWSVVLERELTGVPYMAKAKKKPKPRKLLLDDEDYLRRGIAAWFRGGGYDQPANDSGVEDCNGKSYVVLRNVNGTLAVYRIRNEGILKRLKRWPEEIE